MSKPVDEFLDSTGGLEKARRERDSARGLLADARAQLKEARLEIAEMDRRFQIIAEIKEPVTVVKIRTPHKKGGRPKAIPVIAGADWHVGEHVTLGETNGLNEYTDAIAEQRNNTHFERGLWMIEKDRSKVDMPLLVAPMLGDLMAGHIHEDIRQSSTMTPTEQVRFMKRLLIAGLDYWLEKGDFERIIVPCIWGNHGRTTERELVSQGGRNSYEAMAFWDLRDHYADEPRIEVHVASGPLLYVNIDGYMIRVTHGRYGFTYQGGVGGPMIPINRVLPQWDRGVSAHLTVMGHLHTYLDFGRGIICGSTVGYNAFAASKGFAPEPAQQAYATFDPISKRRTGGAPIFVEPPEEWEKRRQKAMG